MFIWQGANKEKTWEEYTLNSRRSRSPCLTVSLLVFVIVKCFDSHLA
jgi:hypothetical protein